MLSALGPLRVPQNSENCRSWCRAYGAGFQQEGTRRIAESIEGQQIQYSVWYDDQALAGCFGWERAQKSTVELLRQVNVNALSPDFLQVFACQLFNSLASGRQHLDARVLLGNPNAIRVRLAEHVFQHNLVGTQACLDNF